MSLVTINPEAQEEPLCPYELYRGDQKVISGKVKTHQLNVKILNMIIIGMLKPLSLAFS